jgi:peptidoglycan/LPS O-acetylase OafA/YrhL
MRSNHKPSIAYRPDIDGLRAVAVLSVVGFHVFPELLPGGFTGVDIFFVISGYLITSIVVEALNQNTFSVIGFYGRRIRRLFPALFVVLTTFYVVGWYSLVPAEFMQLGKHMAGGAGFVSNLVLWNESGYFDAAADTKPFLHLWSLGVEEQFYLIWPVVLLIAHRFKLGVLRATIGIGLASFLFNYFGVQVDPAATFYSPHTRFWELLVGAALSVIGASIASETGRHANVFSILGFALVGFGLFAITNTTAFPGAWALLPVIGAALIIAAGQRAWLNARLLSHPAIVWVGLISYPLYLWHWPLLSFARIYEQGPPGLQIKLILVGLSFSLAALTRAVIETPVRLAARPLTPSFALLALMALAGSLGFMTYRSGGLDQRSVAVRNQEPPLDTSVMLQPTASFDIPHISDYTSRMIWGDKEASKKLLVWGDSTSGTFLPPFLKVAKARGFSVWKIEHQGCPPLLEVRKERAQPFKNLEGFCDLQSREEIRKFMTQLKPDMIILLSAWNLYVPNSSYTPAQFLSPFPDGEPNRATTDIALKQKLPKTLEILSEIGSVGVVTEFPNLPGAIPFNYVRIPFLSRPKPAVTIPVDEFNKESAFLREIFTSLKTPVAYFDAAKKLCNEAVCSSHIDGVRMYYGSYHVTPQGAMAYEADVAALFDQMDRKPGPRPSAALGK